MNQETLLTSAETAPETSSAPPAPSQDIPPAAAQAQQQGAKMFIDPPSAPTIKGPKGILFDFNMGCRIQVPEVKGDPWQIKISDRQTCNIVFQTEMLGGAVQTTKKYYVPLRIEISRGGKVVFEHELDMAGKAVQIQIPVGTLGDAIAWFTYVDHFRQKHDCKLTCILSEVLIPLFEESYPDIRFVTMAKAAEIQNEFYASYRMGLFFNDWECTHQPVDFRYVGLHKTAAHILGVEPIEEPPRIHIPTKLAKREIPEPYVCIAVQSSTYCKYWNNPYGWLGLVKWLKESGYRVLCMDRDAVWGVDTTWTSIPHGAEDFTGKLPLVERAALLKHADFFVGLSSGLAWLSWAVGTPTVMISGFTHPNNEFQTPYRVFNQHTCNSCWNDPKVMFDHHDFMWCPRHKGTPRQYECTRLITLPHVQSVIRTIPGFLGAEKAEA